jgi:threonylcarbamoyladenosine tRNA methylthiotransferase MtaB
MKVYLRTFGCRANQYDTEAVRAMVVAAGGEIVHAPTDADVAVFNSCAVTADAVADLRQSVRRVARTQPGVRSVVMGCAAAREATAISALPSVDHVIPGADFDAIAIALGLPNDARAAAPVAQTGTRALLRIQDGCDEHCTFCATTLARGSQRSRPADELVDEARQLAEWHPEIVLTGIHIGTYGADSGSSLSQLVERLVCEVPAVRFRLSSVEATEVDDRLRELFDDPRRVAPHLHAPLQSASDAVLRRMGRHWYTAASYAAAIDKLVSGRTVFALGADIITGFPGETEADHRQTLAMANELPFTYLHVFPYSVRPGTAAERLRPRVTPAVAGERAAELRAAGASAAHRYRARRLSGPADCVVLEGRPTRQALTEDFLTVALADPALPRGTRFRARLEGDVAQLLAVEVPAIIQ